LPISKPFATRLVDNFCLFEGKNYSFSMFVYAYVDEKFIANTFNSQCMKDYYLCGKKKSEEVFQLSPILYA
jgi:hypothetical protein